jgi:N-acetyl-anhydromuramyl-L-alanine amidase AmpD
MRLRLFAAVAALALAPGCAGEIEGPESDDLVATPLDKLYEDAAVEFDVPATILKSIGYVETTWQMVEGEQEFDNQPAAFGLMALRGDRLTQGAALAGVSDDDVRYDEASNIRAAAALLDQYATETGIDRADLGAWAEPVARYSAIEDADARNRYVVQDVYGVLAAGATQIAESGEPLVTLEAQAVQPQYVGPDTVAYAGTSDYPAAVWRPSPNYSSRPSGNIGKVGMVIIHTCEGGYAGCWGWLRNSAAGASAHYVVKENGSEITQLVRESKRAWHIAATYACSRNSSKDCWRNGYSSNHFTVGIEHAGYASQSSFPAGQIEASAKLVCNITKDHGISRDRYHILGHGQLQPWNRTDPGKNWPWTHYINRVKAYCGTTTPPGGGGGGDTSGTIVVDSNNANNNAAKAKVEVSGNWKSANSTPGYYGSGYWWAGTQAVSDGASFWFYLPAAATKTVDAWWTAGSNRSAAAPFVAFDSAGNKLGSVTKDQRSSGKQWVKLGTWNFKKGWNRVVLSRWAAAGSVVVADAVRVR